MTHAGLTPVVVTDPPFNIGYRYKGFTDRMDEGDYYAMLAEVTAQTAAVVIHYPEQLHRLSIEKGEAPERVVSWVYNSNTRKQHRDVAFYGVKPDFNRVKQPYKNQNDKRIRKLMAEGKGARLYDWWNVNQVWPRVGIQATTHVAVATSNLSTVRVRARCLETLSHALTVWQVIPNERRTASRRRGERGLRRPLEWVV